MSHPINAGFEAGNHWVNCPRCGLDYRHSQMKKEWTGLWVCAEKCWEPRHPQDFVRAIPDKIAPQEPIRPIPTATFVTVTGQTQLDPTPTQTFGKDFSP